MRAAGCVVWVGQARPEWHYLKAYVGFRDSAYEQLIWRIVLFWL